MTGPQLVFVYGPPAVGKLTVARELASRHPFRVLHNHVTIDAVKTVLPFGTDAFWGVVGRFRRDLVATAAREGIDLVYTYVFAPGDEPHVDAVVAPYEEAGGRVTLVRLTASTETLLERVTAESRQAHGKIAEPGVLLALLGEHDVHTEIPERPGLTIDTETTTAAEAAELILRRL